LLSDSLPVGKNYDGMHGRSAPRVIIGLYEGPRFHTLVSSPR